MDADRFDSLARSLTAACSRRRVLAALGGALALTVAGVSGQEAAAKKKKKKPCPPCKKRKQGTCKKKPDGIGCPGGTCLRGRCIEPTCEDGVQNGSETGVDCGGGCKRCTTGQGCSSPNDCAGALCSGGTCQTCTASPDTCGIGCNCRLPDTGGSSICIKNAGTGNRCESSACPPGEICINNIGPRDCFKPCGAP